MSGPSGHAGEMAVLLRAVARAHPVMATALWTHTQCTACRVHPLWGSLLASPHSVVSGLFCVIVCPAVEPSPSTRPRSISLRGNRGGACSRPPSTLPWETPGPPPPGKLPAPPPWSSCPGAPHPCPSLPTPCCGLPASCPGLLCFLPGMAPVGLLAMVPGLCWATNLRAPRRPVESPGWGWPRAPGLLDKGFLLTPGQRLTKGFEHQNLPS